MDCLVFVCENERIRFLNCWDDFNAAELCIIDKFYECCACLPSNT